MKVKTQNKTAPSPKGMGKQNTEGKPSTETEEAVIRLRKSLITSSERFHEAGRLSGRQWAERSAETVQLERLERATEDGSHWIMSGDEDGARKFFAVIEPEQRGDETELRSFWSSNASEHEYTEPAYIESFIDGAMEVWSEIKDEVYNNSEV